jgi:hypothetical protein
MTLSGNMNCSPFEIFDREVDEVITIINFYIELGATENSITKKENNKFVNNSYDFWDM